MIWWLIGGLVFGFVAAMAMYVSQAPQLPWPESSRARLDRSIYELETDLGFEPSVPRPRLP